MDPSTLSDRLRAIVGAPGARRPRLEEGVPASAGDGALVRETRAGGPEEALGGGWVRQGEISCFVVERRYAPEAAHGRERVKSIADRLAQASGEAALVMATPGAPPFLFFDLETTGLSGGAGTYAFLAGVGSFGDDGGFVTRQYVLLRHAHERQLLQGLGAELARAGALVSFNGKSFDAPLIETRHLYHRLDWKGAALPHLDVLHPARRFWGDTHGEAACSLTALERAVLGARRAGDVPGVEIPARYFEFLRSGDARPLAAVLEHNRLDLLSLAGLAARLLDLIRRGPAAVRHAREALALGRVYMRRGLESRAREAYECAMNQASASMAHKGASMAHNGASMAHSGASMAHNGASMAPIKIDALRSLGQLARRARRYEEAAAYWRQLLEAPGCPPHLIREASEALAVHHEHRARDLPAARAFALKSLIGNESPNRVHDEAVRHRLARIEKKMSGIEVSRLTFESPGLLRPES